MANLAIEMAPEDRYFDCELARLSVVRECATLGPLGKTCFGASISSRLTIGFCTRYQGCVLESKPISGPETSCFFKLAIDSTHTRKGEQCRALLTAPYKKGAEG